LNKEKPFEGVNTDFLISRYIKGEYIYVDEVIAGSGVSLFQVNI
jgi:hypothetical protein